MTQAQNNEPIPNLNELWDILDSLAARGRQIRLAKQRQKHQSSQRPKDRKSRD